MCPELLAWSWCSLGGWCADLYAILKTTEKLERAYVRDAVTAKDYELQCSKLIGQYKTLWESLRGQARLG